MAELGVNKSLPSIVYSYSWHVTRSISFYLVLLIIPYTVGRKKLTEARKAKNRRRISPAGAAAPFPRTTTR